MVEEGSFEEEGYQYTQSGLLVTGTNDDMTGLRALYRCLMLWSVTRGPFGGRARPWR